MDCIISESHAKLNDEAQRALFLATLPDADDLESLLMQRKVVSTRDYEDDAMIARFVRSNGTDVVCYAVRGVTIDEAEMIAAQCELLSDWNIDTFTQAVHTALDAEI